MDEERIKIPSRISRTGSCGDPADLPATLPRPKTVGFPPPLVLLAERLRETRAQAPPILLLASCPAAMQTVVARRVAASEQRGDLHPPRCSESRGQNDSIYRQRTSRPAA